MTIQYDVHSIPYNKENYDTLMQALFPACRKLQFGMKSADSEELSINLYLTIGYYPACCGYNLAYHSFEPAPRPLNYTYSKEITRVRHRTADSCIDYLQKSVASKPTLFSDIKDGTLYQVMSSLAKLSGGKVGRLGSFRNPNSGNRVYTNVIVPRGMSFSGAVFK